MEVIRDLFNTMDRIRALKDERTGHTARLKKVSANSEEFKKIRERLYVIETRLKSLAKNRTELEKTPEVKELVKGLEEMEKRGVQGIDSIAL